MERIKEESVRITLLADLTPLVTLKWPTASRFGHIN